MGRLWVRTVMVLVGSAVLAVYTAGAIGGLLLFHGLIQGTSDTMAVRLTISSMTGKTARATRS